MTVSEIARQAGLSKGAAYQTLATLEARRFVMRADDSALYKLGWGLYELGSNVARDVDITRIARHQLDKLAQRRGSHPRPRSRRTARRPPLPRMVARPLRMVSLIGGTSSGPYHLKRRGRSRAPGPGGKSLSGAHIGPPCLTLSSVRRVSRNRCRHRSPAPTAAVPPRRRRPGRFRPHRPVASARPRRR